MEIRFFHLADIHIGKCYSTHCLSHAHAESRRNETWGTFARICGRAKDEDVDFILITGDLFDSHYCSLQDLLGVSELFASLSPLSVYLIAGNHDPLGEKSVYHWVKWPKNVHVFSSQKFEEIELDGKNLSIWGKSWNRKEDSQNCALPHLNADVRNLLMHHGDLDLEGSIYANLSSKEMQEEAFEYVALGHIHRPEIFQKFTGAYAGSPEPLDFGEYGEHGYMDVRLKDRHTDIEFVAESSRKFVALQIEASTTDAVLSLAAKIRDQVIELQPKRDFFKVTIEGYWEGQFESALDQLKALLQHEFYDLTIRDKTKADLNIERLEQIYGDSAIGRYIRVIQSSALDESVQKEALYIGLEALLKGKNR